MEHQYPWVPGRKWQADGREGSGNRLATQPRRRPPNHGREREAGDYQGWTGAAGNGIHGRHPEYPENVVVCGDAASGASLVVRAMASGKEAAKKVDVAIKSQRN